MKVPNVKIDRELHKMVKTLAATKEKKILELVDEALRDLLSKYGIQ